MRRLVSGLARSLAGVALVASAQIAQAAVTLETSGATLTGAKGFVVGGSTYNVSFGDVFTGALLSPTVAASLAGQLMSQVFTSGNPVFDTLPALTNGCGGVIGTCTMYIPTAYDEVTFSGAFARNSFSESGIPFVVQGDGTGTVGPTAVSSVDPLVVLGVTVSDSRTFASFTLDPLASGGAVPEPSTWLLMTAGFGIAGWALRRGRTRDLRMAAA